MKKNANLSDTAKLERFQLALTNAMSDAAIGEALSKFGLSNESLEEGKALLANTRKAYELFNSRRRKRILAYAEFIKQKNALNKLYLKHRRFAKLIFEDNKEVYESLGLSMKYRTSHANWIEMLKSFYSYVNSYSAVKEQLAQLKITTEEIDTAASAIAPLEKARADFMIEKGASQDATDAKDKAFEQMDDWMLQFFALSRVAFRKQPQLMESFGVVVKN